MKQILLLLLIAPVLCFGQNLQKKILTIQKPSGWYSLGSNTEVIENIFRVLDNSTNAKRLAKDINERGEVLFSYSKYDLNTISGLSPTINVAVIKNNKLNFDQFKLYTKSKTVKELKGVSNNLNVHYTKERLFGEKLAIELHTSFNLDGYSERIRSWVYFIPINDIVYQLSFSDLQNDKCNDLYENIINGLK